MLNIRKNKQANTVGNPNFNLLVLHIYKIRLVMEKIILRSLVPTKFRFRSLKNLP